MARAKTCREIFFNRIQQADRQASRLINSNRPMCSVDGEAAATAFRQSLYRLNRGDLTGAMKLYERGVKSLGTGEECLTRRR